MTLGGERGSVQTPFLRYAQEAGWTYLTPDEALILRRGITSPILDSVFIAQLQMLNPGVVDLILAPPGKDEQKSMLAALWDLIRTGKHTNSTTSSSA